MKKLWMLGVALCALVAVPFSGLADVPVVGPLPYTFTTSGQSNVWACNSGQSSFALTVPAGLTGTFTVTVSQSSTGQYIQPPYAYAAGSTAYTNTITNSGSLTVNLGSNGYVKVADTSYTSGSVTVSGSCSSAVAVIPPQPAPTSGNSNCSFAGAVLTCATPTPLPSPVSGNSNCAWGGTSGLTISCATPTPLPSNVGLTSITANAAATPQASPSGTNGYAVIAQATASPTLQPGNTGISGSSTVGGSYKSAVPYGGYGFYFTSGASSGFTGFAASSSTSLLGVTASEIAICNYQVSCQFTMDASGNSAFLGSITAGNIIAADNTGTAVGFSSGIRGGNGNTGFGLQSFSTTNPNAFYMDVKATSGPSSHTVWTKNSGGITIMNLDMSGNLTATNFFTGSRRMWKKNIVDYTFDPLQLLGRVDFKEYDCKPNTPCGVGHKVGIIADDSPTQIAGVKHDHYDAFALAAIDGAAIKELALRMDGLERMVFRLCALPHNRKLDVCKSYTKAR